MTISADILQNLLSYDPATGLFSWKAARRGCPPSGTIAGTKAKNGYWSIQLNRRRYLSHRLAWLYAYGEFPLGQIDHINCNPADNRLANLRLATQSDNNANARRQTRNTSGFKGVSYNKLRRRARVWQAYITKGGKKIYLGGFESPEDAHSAYLSAAKAFFGEFARAS